MLPYPYYALIGDLRLTIKSAASGVIRPRCGWAARHLHLMLYRCTLPFSRRWLARAPALIATHCVNNARTLWVYYEGDRRLELPEF